MNTTKAEHERYKSLYISLPSSAKQHREITKLIYVLRIFENANDGGQFFVLSIGIER